VESAIARRAFTQIRVGAAILALAFGASVYATATSYAKTYPTAASRAQVAALTSGNRGLVILLGPIGDIASVGGYTVYKIFVFLTTIGAIWALLAGTRLLRGEEDAGRWSLVLAGSTRPARATAATLVSLALAVGVVFAGTLVLSLLAARDPALGLGAAQVVLYCLSLVIAPAVFAAVGALTSQLVHTRRAATGLALAVFGVTFVLRMIGDAGSGTHWLLWSTPFGWIELIRPFTENNVWPLLPAVIAVAALATASIVLADRRDVGEGVLAVQDVRPLRPRGLGSVFGLTARLELPVLTAWCAGAAVAGFGLGVFARLTTQALPTSFGDTLSKYGVHGSFVNEYLGIAFLLTATVVALLPAGQVGAAAAEETSGRLTHILSRPARRRTWLLGRLLLPLVAIVIAGVLGGLGTWVGAGSQGVDLGLLTLLGAGLNVIPTGVVALGIGAVLLSAAPRAAATTVYGLVLWSVFIDMLTPFASGLDWLKHLSLFNYMALVPGQKADPTTITVTALVGVLLCAAAVFLFERQDIRSS
jgi:ABC-2 type transport system permease protein